MPTSPPPPKPDFDFGVQDRGCRRAGAPRGLETAHPPGISRRVCTVTAGLGAALGEGRSCSLRSALWPCITMA